MSGGLVHLQEAIKFVRQYGADTVRLLEFEQNRGKGGAVRIVRPTEHLLLSASVPPHPRPHFPAGLSEYTR